MANSTLKIFGRIVLVAMLVISAAYGLARLGAFEWPRRYDPLALPDLTEPPGPFAAFQMKLLDTVPANCAIALAQTGNAAALQPTQSAGPACIREGTVMLSHLSRATLRPEETRCAIAARLYVWDRYALQPLAHQMLGQSVAEILHFGSYACRAIRGQSVMSEHATANAFDIAGFRLSNGHVISVKAAWQGNSADARFLHAARDSLCDNFNLVLSPDYNADHADHFHADMGWWRSCR
jgi:hypothetical protein